MLSPRRALVIGLPVGVGILMQSVSALTTSFSGTSLEHVLAPMTFATIVAIVLNIIMRIGIRQKETMVFAGDAGSVDTTEILGNLGERWGMHRQTGTRAAATMSEMLEVLGAVADGPIDCTIAYNELALTLTFSYDGPPLVVPATAPTAEDLADAPDGVMQMGAWIVLKLTDYMRATSSGGRQQVHMAFEC